MDTRILTLVETEQAIYNKYQWWHQNSPGVHPREHGVLADLWRRADYLYAVPEGAE